MINDPQTGLKIIECPRDAWQGLKPWIRTELKAKYINALLRVGFDSIDFGSFVSPKAMPQVSDTAKLVGLLEESQSPTKLLAIVANARGADEALQFERIFFLGYPFSVSETFQKRNANSSIAESAERVAAIQALCEAKKRALVIYLSMGFGNPYGDPWSLEIVIEWVAKLSALGVRTFSLADTVGVAEIKDIKAIFKSLTEEFPSLEFGGHFHARQADWRPKIEAAYEAGCRRFDGAIMGYGGCPMAQDDLVGNIATENLLEFAQGNSLKLTEINRKAFTEAEAIFAEIIAKH